MAEKMDMRFLKKICTRFFSCLVVVFGLLCFDMRPSYAQCDGCVVSAVTAGTAAITAAVAAGAASITVVVEEVANDLADLTVANGAQMATQASLSVSNAQMMTDTIDANIAQNTTKGVTQKIAADNIWPMSTVPNTSGNDISPNATLSACAITQGNRAVTNQDELLAGAAQAATRAVANRPSGPAAVSADLKSRMALGLVPCNNTTGTTATDPDAQTGQALNCSQYSPPWGNKYQGMDQTKSALFNYLQFPVPPNYVQAFNGVYQPLQMPPSPPSGAPVDYYMPFIAAYSYCTHLTPRRSVAPLGATADAVMATQNYSDITSKSTEALDECMSLLQERAQYGDATTGMVGTKYLDLHMDQQTKCMDDGVIGVLDGSTAAVTQAVPDTTPVGICITHGRSALQALHDDAFRMGAGAFTGNYMAAADKDTIMAEVRASFADRSSFLHYIQNEKMLLDLAIMTTQSSPSGVDVSQSARIVK